MTLRLHVFHHDLINCGMRIGHILKTPAAGRRSLGSFPGLVPRLCSALSLLAVSSLVTVGCAAPKPAPNARSPAKVFDAAALQVALKALGISSQEMSSQSAGDTRWWAVVAPNGTRYPMLPLPQRLGGKACLSVKSLQGSEELTGHWLVESKSGLAIQLANSGLYGLYWAASGEKKGCLVRWPVFPKRQVTGPKQRIRLEVKNFAEPEDIDREKEDDRVQRKFQRRYQIKEATLSLERGRAIGQLELGPLGFDLKGQGRFPSIRYRTDRDEKDAFFSDPGSHWYNHTRMSLRDDGRANAEVTVHGPTEHLEIRATWLVEVGEPEEPVVRKRHWANFRWQPKVRRFSLYDQGEELATSDYNTVLNTSDESYTLVERRRYSVANGELRSCQHIDRNQHSNDEESDDASEESMESYDRERRCWMFVPRQSPASAITLFGKSDSPCGHEDNASVQ